MVIYFIIIKQTISYEFITFTHTLEVRTTTYIFHRNMLNMHNLYIKHRIYS